MSDPFDQDLRHSLREGPGNSLKGWEFSPAMRQAVLDRVRTEGPALSAPTRRRPVAIPRAALWATVAAAAAAFLLAINMDGFPLGRMGSTGRKAEAPIAAAPESAMVAPSAAPAPPEKPKAAGSMDAAAGGSVAQVETTSAPAMMAAAPPRGVVAIMLEAPASVPAPAPPAKLSIMARAAEVTLVTGDTQAVAIRGAAVFAIDSAGRTQWELSLNGVAPDSRIAVAPGGQSAIGVGREVYVVNASGRVERTLTARTDIEGLALAADGRVAVAHTTGVDVYRDGTLQFTAGGLASPEIAFAADGRLAALSRGPAERRFTVRDPAGADLLTASIATSGRGVALSSDQTIAVGGGVALDRSGAVTWRMRLSTTAGMLSQGLAIVGWDAETVVAVRPTDGAEIWRATLSAGPGSSIQLVTGSSDGLTAVVAAQADGAAVWVLDAEGTERLKLHLPAAPVAAGLVGARLVAFMPDGTIETRGVNP